MRVARIILMVGVIILLVSFYKNVVLPQFSDGKDSTIL